MQMVIAYIKKQMVMPDHSQTLVILFNMLKADL